MAVTEGPVPQDESDNGSQQQQQQQQQQQHQPTTAPPPSHPPHALHQHSLSNASTVTVDIESWTVAALESLNIAPIARGTGTALSFSIDSHDTPSAAAPAGAVTTQMKLRNVAFDSVGTGAGIAPPRRPPMRRDSLKRREELLKGKEGSRQRRRWENGQLFTLTLPSPSPEINLLPSTNGTYLRGQVIC